MLAVALADDAGPGHRARARLRGRRLTAPELIDLEVLSVVRGLARAGRLGEQRAAQAVRDLATCRYSGSPTGVCSRIAGSCATTPPRTTPPILALAELLEAPLLTADRRMAAVAGTTCRVDVLP